MDKKNQDLIFGIEGEKELILPENSRFENLIVIGTKNSGKTTKIIPAFAKQQISYAGDVGCTFVVNNKDSAFFIASLAQRLKRKTQVKIIKPSADLNTYKAIIEDKKYDYEDINKIIDYKQEIRDKSIIIIDVEEFKYKEQSKRFLKKLFKQLYIDMQNVEKTLGRKHYLFVDDADEYIDDLKDILIYGKEFNVATTLFIDSFVKLNEDKKIIIEECIKNYILLSNLVSEDIEYFTDKLSVYIDNFTDYNEFQYKRMLLRKSIAIRKSDILYYEIVLNNGIRKSGKTTLFNEYLKTEEERESVYGIAKKIKKRNIIPDNNIPFKIDIDTFNEKYYPDYLDTKKNIQPIKEELDNTVSTNIITDAILDNINDIPELYEDDDERFDLSEFVQPKIENDNSLNQENIVSKKKKKKKKKKKNNTIENNIENVVDSVKLNDNDSKESEIKENQLDTDISNNIEITNNNSINKTIDIIESNDEDDDIQQEYIDDNTIVSTNLDPFKEYGRFEDYNVVEDDNSFYIDLNNEKDLTVKISPKEKETKPEIDNAFANTIEGFAEKVIEDTEKIENENSEDISNKTFFNIDSLFDDDNEE